jgi:maltose-binding protein MalE
MGDVTAEMNHDKNIAELQNKVRDDKRQAANYLAQDARTREANASSAALRREQIQALKDAKPSPESRAMKDALAAINSNDTIAAIAQLIKSGSLVPGTPEFNKYIRATEAIAAPIYERFNLTPPNAAQLMEDAAEPEKKGFWASLFGSSSKPAAVISPPPNVQKVLDKYKPNTN